MRSRLLRTGFLAMVAMGVVLTVPASSHALFTVTLHQAGVGPVDVVVTDNILPDQSASTGVIFLGPETAQVPGGFVFGDYRIGIFAQAFSIPGSGSANLQASTFGIITRFQTTAGAGALTITMTENDFGNTGHVPAFENLPNGAYNLHNALTLVTYVVNGTNTVAIPGASLSGAAQASPDLATTPPALLTLGGTGASSDVTFNKTATPFTMNHVIVIAGLGTDQSISIQASSTLSNIVPAPSSAILALAGLPMIGLFGWLRARRKNVEMAASVA